ncbi:MAG: response regulator transcription factor [Candidatus Omnitrophica bacterium]|nr:response regulator transcription factor [Candidatus Omnitrophota bacterium]
MNNKLDIILADDHEIFREGLKSLIDKDAAINIVAEARDGEELLQAVRKNRCDVIVTDLSMPNMDGLVAIRRILKSRPRARILVLTMLKDHEHFRHAMNSGACGYILKDDAYEQFVTAVKTLARGKKYISPSVSQLETDRYLRTMEDTEAPSLSILTKRELQILRFVAAGLANKNIANELNISVRTVETHRNNLTNKLGIKATAGLVKYALTKGLV